MTYCVLFLKMIIILSCSIYPFAVTMAGQRPSLPQMSAFDMEKEIQEANKVIEEYISGLSPEEQAEFNRAVEEMSQMFENMSDEDFDKFLGEMFSEDQMPQPDYFEPESVIQEEAIETPQLSVEQLKKVETALAILNDIIKQTNLFTVIISTSPELPNRINQWAKKGDLSNWQEGTDWDKLKVDIDNLIQKLYKLQDQDVVTKEYKYLLDLIADATLYDNLIQLRNNLNSLLPVINVPEFGIEKLSSQSKSSIKNIINQYTEKLYALEFPKALNTIIEKYDPQAKKLREAEERASKRALEASKEPRTPAEPTEAGVEEEGGYDSGYGYGSYDNYYPDYGYGGGYDYGYSPSYGGGYEGSMPTAGGSASGRGGSSGGGTSSGSAKSEKVGEEKKKEEEEKEKAVQFIPNEEAAEQIGKIKTNLETINSTLKSEDYPQLADLASHLTGKTEPVNDTLANYILPTVIDKKVTALSDSIKRLTDLSKKMNSKTLTTYQAEVKKTFDKNKKELEKLSKDIAQFKQTEEEKEGKEKKKSAEKEEETEKVTVSRLSKEKRWAYFADEKAKEELGDNELLTKIVHPKSLFDIKKNIDGLLKDVQTFLKKKAAVPKKEPAENKKS